MVVANMVRALDVSSHTKNHTYILQRVVDKQSIFGEARHQSSGNFGVAKYCIRLRVRQGKTFLHTHDSLSFLYIMRRLRFNFYLLKPIRDKIPGYTADLIPCLRKIFIS